MIFLSCFKSKETESKRSSTNNSYRFRVLVPVACCISFLISFLFCLLAVFLSCFIQCSLFFSLVFFINTNIFLLSSPLLLYKRRVEGGMSLLLPQHTLKFLGSFCGSHTSLHSSTFSLLLHLFPSLLPTSFRHKI